MLSWCVGVGGCAACRALADGGAPARMRNAHPLRGGARGAPHAALQPCARAGEWCRHPLHPALPRGCNVPAPRAALSRRATRDALTAACLCVARVRCCACRRVCARALRRLRCCVPPARGSLWNAAHDDTIPDPVAKKASFTGLHNAGWLWNTGDHTTGASVHDITGQDTHVPFH